MKKYAVLALVFAMLMIVSVRAEQGYDILRLKLDVQTTTKGDLDLPDSSWLEMLNAGIQNTASKVDCVIDTITVITSIGTFEYSLPANFQKLWHAIDKSEQKVYDVISADKRGQGKTGMEIEEKKIYTFASAFIKTIGFYPTPTIADTALVYYFATPEIYDSDTNDIAIAESFHPALKIACLVEVWERTERYDKANRERALLINEINNTRARLQRTPDVIVGPRVITRDY